MVSLLEADNFVLYSNTDCLSISNRSRTDFKLDSKAALLLSVSSSVKKLNKFWTLNEKKYIYKTVEQSVVKDVKIYFIGLKNDLFGCF